MTKRALLPGLPAPNFPDPALQRWALAITERMEVREGARGDPLERVLTLKDLQKPATPATVATNGASPNTLSGYAPIPTGNGGFVSLDINAVAEQLRRTKLYTELQLSINDPSRFDKLGTELKTSLARSLASEAAIRGAQISRSELIVNEVSRSVSATVTELTASIESASAGIRSSQFAIATETTAIAGQVTQLEARLQVPVDPADLLPVPPAAAYATLAALTSAVPAASADTRKYYRVTSGAGEVLYRSDGSTWNLVGTEDSAKLEQVLLVEADKTEGLSAQYTLKVSAGKAIAGFGIAATERDGVPESAFIVQADKFALTTPYTFSQEATPTATAIGQTWYKPSTLVSYRATATGTGGWVVYTPAIPFVVDTTTGSVYITGTLRVGGSSAPTLTTVGSATTNFNGRNDRNATTVVAPTIASDGTAVDHTINTDGSADYSLEWSWAGTEADIDGFVITVYSAATNAAYTFGTTPAAEQKYVVPADKRAIIGYGIAADRYYKFSVQAYRVVDPDVNAAGILLSARAIPSLAAENPYRPDANVAFAGNVSGTVNGVAAATITTATTNFNGRNDRNATAVVAPTIATDGTAIDHTINTDGSCDISFEWAWAGAEADIDGFIIFGRVSTSSSAYTFGTTPADEVTYYVPANKRALLAYGQPTDKYYTFGVQAYRVVDPDINATGLIKSTLVKATGAGENPYRPSASVAFAGDITGTVSGTAASTVVAGAADGAAALSAVSNPTTGLATKMGNAQKNILTGEGGLKIGATIDWDSTGANATGVGLAITSKGIVGRNSSGVTFTIDATTGDATFSGDISGASGTFSANLNIGGSAFFSGSTYNAASGYTSSVTIVPSANSGTGLEVRKGAGSTGTSVVFTNNASLTGTLLCIQYGTGYCASFNGGSGVLMDALSVSGTMAANAITVSSTTRVANLNATRLYDKDWTEYCSLIVGNTGTAYASGAGFNITVGPGMSGSYAFTASSNNVVLDVISDERLKKDISSEVLGLEFINALKPVTYRMKVGTEMLHHGFIAQDVEAVLGKGADSLTVENAEGIKGLNYTSLIGPMAKAIQELTARIVALETP